MDFNAIPSELREYSQFCVWRYEETDKDRPTKVPYQVSGDYAKVNEPATWCNFATAVEHAHKWDGIGFILTANDPFGFIDLDEPKNPNGTPLEPEEYAARMEKQRLIFEQFDSYSELSPSGKGLHIIVKGKVESGRRRDSVEVYSDLRFMTMTGNVYRHAPIAERGALLSDLWAQMGKGRDAELFYAGLEHATLSDDRVLELSSTASNGAKFVDLYYNGDWQKYYPSQSEADFALVDILAFYSKNRFQVQKLFLNSKLAERIKSRAQYRINYMLNRCFDNMLPPVNFEGLRDQVNEALARAAQANSITAEVQRNSPVAINEEKEYTNLPPPQEIPENLESIYNPPKGLLGDIAQYIYAQSVYPVPEIALAAAIGLMSGIVGKAYNVSETGLNQYTLLLAATGTGKEFSTRGINRLLHEVKKTVPAVAEFLGPRSFSSPQALQKVLAEQPSILSIQGEFHSKLKEMASAAASTHMDGLKAMYLELYNRSGQGDQTGAIVYSDKTKNSGAISAVSLSIFAESAPEPFYEALNEAMIANGLLPRFMVIDYKGDRVFPNDGAELVKPSEDLVRRVAILCANALTLNSQKKVIRVAYDADAKELLDKFRMECHYKIVGSMEIRRQLWTRAHVKVLKMAATIAVGIHPYQPSIDLESVKWAIRLVTADTNNMISRFETGDVGSNNEENKQVQLVVKIIHKYLTSPWSYVSKYIGPKMESVHRERVVPYNYLQKNTSSAGPFKGDRLGATNALKRTLKTLQDRGDIQAMSKGELSKRFGTVAECFAITDLSAFGL